MIKKYDLSKAGLMFFFNCMSSIKVFLEVEDLEALLLKDIYNEFVEKYDIFDEAIKPTTTENITEQLRQLSCKRKYLFSGLISFCRACLAFPDSEKAVAAKYLLAVINKYGKHPQNTSYTSQTAIIYNLLQDFEQEKSLQSITAIGVSKWILELKSVNSKFTELYNLRTSTDASIVKGNTRFRRKEMYAVYVKLIKIINALTLTKEKHVYQNLINNINEEIKMVTAAIKQNSKRKRK